jgi:hypothetical protein
MALVVETTEGEPFAIFRIKTGRDKGTLTNELAYGRVELSAEMLDPNAKGEWLWFSPNEDAGAENVLRAPVFSIHVLHGLIAIMGYKDGEPICSGKLPEGESALMIVGDPDSEKQFVMRNTFTPKTNVPNQ